MSSRSKFISLLAVLAVSILIIPGCVNENNQYILNGKEYGKTSGSFRGRWWNYYERGRSFSEGRFYQQAIEDFNKAIKGRQKDQWRARTYGMHFVDYFPHRELGVVYFHRDEISKAIEQLEISLQTAPSAKASFFLNKARAVQIKVENLDKGPPNLFLEGKQEQKITNKLIETVGGVAEDDTYVSSINVGGNEVMIELAEPQKVFRQEVALLQGNNLIRIVAKDLTDKTTEKTLNIYCDRRGPQIAIESVTVKAGAVAIKGRVTDDLGLLSLEINNTPLVIAENGSSHSFAVEVPRRVITVKAVDRAGNVTEAVISENEFGLMKPTHRNPLLAAAFSTQATRSGALIVSDAPRMLIAFNREVQVEKEPPYIHLEDLEQETYEDMILLEGRVSDMSEVVNLTLNGEPILNREGKRIFFSVLRKLQVGLNEFRLVAVDKHANVFIKTISVNRKLQKIRQIGSRMSVAVLPFEQYGKEKDKGELIHDQLVDAFLEQRRFNIIERKKIDAILQELQLSRTDLIDPDHAIRFGIIVAAQTILAGSIMESPGAIEVVGRLIDTETATVLASNDMYSEAKDLVSLGNLLSGLAFKFKRDFPLLEGILLEVREKEVLVDIGGEQSLIPNMRLLCYRDGPVIKHPVTGKSFGSEPRILGKIKVVDVYDQYSKAAILDRQEEMRPTDRVIVQ